MKWKTISKFEAESVMQSWGGAPEESFDNEYEKIRNDLFDALHKSLKDLKITKDQIKGNEYQFDLRFGIELYDILSEKNEFNLRNASENGIWRYLSVRVVPDIVFLRWGMNPGRFWRESRRIWLKALWWYVHLSWQKDKDTTFKILKDNTADEIVQLVERSGPLGYRVELARAIMKYYGEMPVGRKKRGQQVFRRAMKLNTARTRVVEPALMPGGEIQYVKELFDYFD